jgi:hypothetical protein
MGPAGLRARASLLAGAALIGGLLAAPSSAATSVVTTTACIASVPEPDLRAPGPTKICMSLFRPAWASARRPVPVVMHSHGWGGTRNTSPDEFSAYLHSGVAVVSIDQRGHGESTGAAHVEDPAFEGEDMVRVIDYLASLPWVQKDRPGDPRLGSIGGSYGGGFQWVAAFTEVMKTGRTRIDVMSPESSWYSLNESLGPSEVPKSEWLSILYATGSRQHTTTVHAEIAKAMATGDYSPNLHAFFDSNGPAWHVAKGRRLDIPVLIHQGVTDNLFPLGEALKNFQYSLTPRARARSILLGFTGGHAAPSVLPLGVSAGADPCVPRLAKGVTDWKVLEHRFVVGHLKRLPNTIRGLGRFHLTTADGSCITVDNVMPDRTLRAAPVSLPTGPGAPQAVELAKGPLTVAGRSFFDGVVTSVGTDNRAFLSLSVGTSAADARIVQNKVQPLRVPGTTYGAQCGIELPAVAVVVPKGQSLFLTVSPTSDMFALHGSRAPGLLQLDNIRVRLPVVRGR